ncbi:DEAD/DEAH box helicase [Zobellia galactanivorans]|uniref:DEAD/DEAH RNA helicase n=1 Tax=Zobellia galactanivorans (strain DSM 12802 / CCUG 47099 / CIP 106680 / NCIMB 13871 / Dsij) TaxID=63186 RepID=G0LA79_ZOBGA|nr:DEAD/DEAH box helicase [Zobellia galactanivorans]CAZ95123.1 DEAD/DEAH RNA helicase [Zobellia galactanivorans]
MNYKKNKFRTKTSGRRPASTLNPELLVKKSTGVLVTPFESERSFDQLELNSTLLKNIEGKGYKSPTEIQEKCIDPLMSGKDLIGIAATGTGKTAAFLIPIVQQMLASKDTTGLVVVPTRELAQQVYSEFKSLTKGTALSAACFIGGTSVNKDSSLARRNPSLIVGTPGRLNDLIDRKALNTQARSVLVLDEFDRMLDMGFIKDIRKIVSGMHGRRQTMLFSATVDPSQERVINEIIGDPLRISVSSGTKSSDNVDQSIIRVGRDENKFEVLFNLVNAPAFEKVLLFAETKRGVDKLSKQLMQSGIRSDVIHGNKSQNYRSRAIELFKSGKTKILVATDVAARGIDIKGVTHVINYQLPQTMDSYIHRIGRTGRAESTGTAYTFVN